MGRAKDDIGLLSHLKDDAGIDLGYVPPGPLSHLEDDAGLDIEEGALFQEAESEGIPLTSGAGPSEYTKTKAMPEVKKTVPKEYNPKGAFYEAVRGLGETLNSATDTIARVLMKDPEWSPEDEIRSVIDPTFGEPVKAPYSLTGEVREFTPRRAWEVPKTATELQRDKELRKSAKDFLDINRKYWKEGGFFKGNKAFGDFHMSVLKGTEAFLTEALGSSGTMGGSMLLRLIPVAGMVLSMSAFYGLNKGELKDKLILANIPEDKAESIAAIGGSIKSLAEQTGLETIMHTFKPASGFLGYLLSIGITMAAEGSEEGFQSLVDVIGVEYSKKGDKSTKQFYKDLWNKKEEYVGGIVHDALIGSTLALGGSAISAPRQISGLLRERAAQQALVTDEDIEDLQRILEQSEAQATQEGAPEGTPPPEGAPIALEAPKKKGLGAYDYIEPGRQAGEPKVTGEGKPRLPAPKEKPRLGPYEYLTARELQDINVQKKLDQLKTGKIKESEIEEAARAKYADQVALENKIKEATLPFGKYHFDDSGKIVEKPKPDSEVLIQVRKKPKAIQKLLPTYKRRLRESGGDLGILTQKLKKEGYTGKVIGYIRALVTSERKTPFTVKKLDADARRVLKYKGKARGTEWYREHGLDELLKDMSDEDILRFFSVISYTSQKADPQSNMTKALRVWLAYKAGYRPEDAVYGTVSRSTEARMAEALKDPNKALKLGLTATGMQTGAVKMADFAETLRRAYKDPKLLQAWNEAVMDFRMGQYFFDMNTPPTGMLRERAKDRVNEIRDYLRKNDDKDFWTTDRVQAALWHHIKDERKAKGLDPERDTSTFRQVLIAKAAKHYGMPLSKVTDRYLNGYIRTQLDGTDLKVFDHYSRRGYEIRDPEYQGTGTLVKGAERKRPERIPRIHFYATGQQAERPFWAVNRMRAIVNSGKIYNMAEDPKGIIKKYVQRLADPDAVNAMEAEIQKSGFIGMESDGVTVVFEPVRAYNMHGYRLSVSPMTTLRKIEAAPNEIKDHLNIIRRHEEAGYMDDVSEIVADDVYDVMNHPLLEITRLENAEGRYLNGKEFSFDLRMEAADETVLKGRVAKLLSKYRQLQGYISKMVSVENARPATIAKNQAASVIWRFDQDLGESQLNQISERLDMYGIGGSTFNTQRNIMILDHIKEHGLRLNEFENSVEHAYRDLWGRKDVAPKSMFVEDVPKPTVGRAWFQHTVLTNKGDWYAKTIERGEQRERELIPGSKEYNEQKRANKLPEHIRRRTELPGEPAPKQAAAPRKITIGSDEGQTLSAKTYNVMQHAADSNDNIYVRRATGKSNKGRILFVQISNMVGQEQTDTEDYFDKLYSNREGFNRPKDFWELPEWIGIATKSIKKSDLLVVRNIKNAIGFLNDTNYDTVMFSVMDVNKQAVKAIADGYNGHVISGGYVDPEYFKGNLNVEFINDLNVAINRMGYRVQPGTDYSMFKDTDTIPRLCMSTGCRHQCAFCTIEKEVVARSDVDINAQLESFKDVNFNLIYLNDKTFGQAKNYKKIKAVFNKIKKFNPKFQGFIIQTTATQFNKFDDKFLQESGIRYVELGVESYNDPILKKLHKPASEKSIDAAAEKIRENNMWFIPNIMVGLAGKGWSETNATYKRTLDFLRKNADIISHVNVYNLALYEGTELEAELGAKSDVDVDENVVERSYMKNKSIHEKFYNDVKNFGRKMLDKGPGQDVKGKSLAQLSAIQLNRVNSQDLIGLLEDVKRHLGNVLTKEELDMIDVRLLKRIRAGSVKGISPKSRREHEKLGKSKLADTLGVTTVNRISAAIDLSLAQDPKEMVHTTYHEAYHVVARWVLPRAMYDRTVNYYGGNEEANADGFAKFSVMKSKDIPNWLRNAYLKIHTFLQKLRSSLNGRGWFAPNDVYEAVWGSSKELGSGRMAPGEVTKAQVRAYHGGPHKVEKFSTKFVGTGEGGQAFGWGLYFTDVKEIAEFYAQPKTPSGERLNVENIQNVKSLVKEGKINEAKEFALSLNSIYTRNKQYGAANDWAGIHGELVTKNRLPKWVQSTNVYRVSLHKGKKPGEYNWLDWNKSPDDKLLRKIKTHISLVETGHAEDYRADNRITAFDIKELLGQYPTGNRLYHGLSKILGSNKEASLFLLRAGIDGIRYPSGTITGPKTGTGGTNYVVFDENAVTIEEHVAFQLRQPDKADDTFDREMDSIVGRPKSSTMEKVSGAYEKYIKDWRFKYLDRFDPIRQKIGKIPYMLHRMQTGVSTSLNTLLYHGKLRWNADKQVLTTDERKAGFLKWLSDQDNVKYKFYWLMAKSAEEMEVNKDREIVVMQEPRRKRIYNKVKELGISNKELDAFAKEVQTWNSSVLDIAEQVGLIDPDKRAQWERYYYVPFYRILEDPAANEAYLGGPVNRSKHLDAQIRRLGGKSEARVGDPIENLIRNWSNLLNQSLKNIARKEAVEWSILNKAVAEDGSPLIEKVKPGEVMSHVTKDGVTYAYRDKTKEGLILSYQDNGTRQYIKVNDPQLFQAMHSLSAPGLNNVIMKMFRTAKHWLTYSATFGPAFRLANLLRDTIHTAFVTKGFKPFWDSGIGIVKALREDQDYVRLMASGASFGGSYLRAEDPKSLEKFVDRVIKKERKQGYIPVIWHNARTALNWWEKIGSASENAARIQIMAKNTKEAGGEVTLEGAFEARDVMDFTMRGQAETVQWLISMLPFVNARVQGMYKLGRAAKENPMRFAAYGVMMTAATVMLWYRNKDKPEYDALEDWDKRAYYHFWIGKYHFRVPKPFEVGAIFGTMVESVLDTWKGKEDMKYFIDTAYHVARDNLSINFVPQAVRPIAEQWANKSFFTGRPIVPQWQAERLSGPNQYDPWTSETTREIAKMFRHISWLNSPKRVEAFIRGYTSTVGMSLLFASDILVQRLADYPSEPKMRIDEYPLLGRFYRSDEHKRSTKYTTKFFEFAKELDKLVGDVNKAKREMDIPEVKRLVEKHGKKLMLKSVVNTTRKQLSEINRRIQQIYMDKRLTSEQKTERINKLTDVKNRRLQQLYQSQIQPAR